jgi:hypothetical protein
MLCGCGVQALAEALKAAGVEVPPAAVPTEARLLPLPLYTVLVLCQAHAVAHRTAPRQRPPLRIATQARTRVWGRL